MVQFDIGTWRYRMLIDRITFRYPLSEIDFTSLWWTYRDSDLLRFRWEQEIEGGSERIATVPLFWDGNLVLRAVRQYGRTYLEFKWSPIAIRDSNREMFHSAIGQLVPGGFDVLLSDGWIGYIEIAIDVFGARAGDLLIYRPRHKHSAVIHNFLDDSDARYISGRFDRNVYTAYDKADELRARHARVTRMAKCRIENRWKTNISFDALRECKNRFRGLLVANRDRALDLDNSVEWQGFLRCCDTEGVQYPMAHYSQRTRRRFIKLLAMAMEEWWVPDLLWQYWPSVHDAFLAHMRGLPPTSDSCFPT